MRRAAAVLALLGCLLALAACGVGPGKGSGDVRLLVTRDFGTRQVGDVPAAQAPGSETVMRYLQRNFTVRTRYGGGFVQSIDGLAGGHDRGRPVDWFFSVNGVEATQGAGAIKLHPGDRVWWDRHDWSATMRVPAVVGSYPEPFLHGSDGKRWPVRIECARGGATSACDAVAKRLGDDGILAAQSTTGAEGGQDTLRVLVGPWSGIREDVAAGLLEKGVRASGIYARFLDRGRRLQLLDAKGEVVRTVGAGAGLIAATRHQDDAPTWFVTGTDAAGVKAAVQAFDEGDLANRFALAVVADRGVPLPVEAGAGP